MSSISGFSRLKSLFSGSLNLRTYKSIVSTAQNAECGNLPKDLLSIFLSKGSIATEKAVNQLTRLLEKISKYDKSAVFDENSEKLDNITDIQNAIDNLKDFIEYAQAN